MVSQATKDLLFFKRKELTCSVCPIRDKCPIKKSKGFVCQEMDRVFAELNMNARTNPRSFSIDGLTRWICRLEAEMSVLPRVSERYMEVVKALKDYYAELHKLKYGTKKTIKQTIAKVDINTLVDQADEAEKVLKDKDGEVIATVKKKKEVKV